MKHSKEYYKILQHSKNWPKWKINVYNQCIAISAHARKLKEESE